MDEAKLENLYGGSMPSENKNEETNNNLKEDKNAKENDERKNDEREENDEGENDEREENDEGENEEVLDSDDNDDSDDDSEESEKEEKSKYPEYDDLELIDLPEGVELDTKLLESAKEIANGAKLPKEALEKFVNLHAEQVIEMAKAQVKANDDTIKEYNRLAKKDEDIGGSNLKQAVKNSVEVIRELGGKDLIGLLKTNPIGSHPAFIKILNKMHTDVISPKKLDKGDSVNKGEHQHPAYKIYSSMG